MSSRRHWVVDCACGMAGALYFGSPARVVRFSLSYLFLNVFHNFYINQYFWAILRFSGMINRMEPFLGTAGLHLGNAVIKSLKI